MWIWFVKTVMFWRREPSSSPHQRQQPQEARDEMRMEHVGDSNVQVGHAGGDVRVINVGSLVQHHAQHHSHITIIQAPNLAPAAMQPDAAGMRQDAPIAGSVNKPTSHEQSAVLRRMDQLRDRVQVLDFMEREFGTRMVIHLKAEQLFRLNRYLDVVLRDARNAKVPKAENRKRTQRVSY